MGMIFWFILSFPIDSDGFWVDSNYFDRFLWFWLMVTIFWLIGFGLIVTVWVVDMFFWLIILNFGLTYYQSIVIILA